MYNAVNAVNTVDTLSQIRGIVLTRLEQLQMSLREYAEQQAMLTQIQLQAAQELHQLEPVLKTLDTDPSLLRKQGEQFGSLIPPAPGMGGLQFQSPGTAQIYSYNAEG